MRPLALVLFLVGYPVAILVIAFLKPVLRERRTTWFVAHQLAVAAIVLGWALLGRAVPVAVNATWLVIMGGLWLRGRTRPAGGP